MSDLTLFEMAPIVAEPVEELSAGQKITRRHRIALELGKHPANGLPIDEAHRCGDCAHFQRLDYHTRHYAKCAYNRLGITHSEASDMRVNWPACPHFKEAELVVPSQPMVRNGDPPTSRKAAEKAADPDRLSALQLRVLGNLYYARMHGRDGGLSDREHPGIIQTTAGKRRLALQRAGLVENSGYETKNPNDSDVTVWRATDAGVAAYLRATRTAA